MGFGNPFSKIKNTFRKAKNEAQVAAEEGEEIAQLEVKEEGIEAVEAKEVSQLYSGLRIESNLLRQIVQSHSSKYSLVKIFSTTDAALRRLDETRRKAISGIKENGKRVLNLSGRLYKSTISGMARRFTAAEQFEEDREATANKARIFNERMKHHKAAQDAAVQAMAKQTALNIKELQLAKAEVSRVFNKNTEIRSLVKKFSAILGRQNSLLTLIKRNTMKRIEKEVEKERLAVEVNEEEGKAAVERRKAVR